MRALSHHVVGAANRHRGRRPLPQRAASGSETPPTAASGSETPPTAASGSETPPTKNFGQSATNSSDVGGVRPCRNQDWMRRLSSTAGASHAPSASDDIAWRRPTRERTRLPGRRSARRNGFQNPDTSSLLSSPPFRSSATYGSQKRGFRSRSTSGGTSARAGAHGDPPKHKQAARHCYHFVAARQKRPSEPAKSM